MALNAAIKQHKTAGREWLKKKLRSKWEIILCEFNGANVNNSLMKKIIEIIFVLTGTNTDCERLFSEINQYWTDEKSQLHVQILEGVMKVKNNINVTYEEFHEMIKNDNESLEEFCSSEKCDE